MAYSPKEKPKQKFLLTNNLICLLALTIIFFTLLTQRVMITSEDHEKVSAVAKSLSTSSVPKEPVEVQPSSLFQEEHSFLRKGVEAAEDLKHSIEGFIHSFDFSRGDYTSTDHAHVEAAESAASIDADAALVGDHPKYMSGHSNIAVADDFVKNHPEHTPIKSETETISTFSKLQSSVMDTAQAFMSAATTASASNTEPLKDAIDSVPVVRQIAPVVARSVNNKNSNIDPIVDDFVANEGRARSSESKTKILARLRPEGKSAVERLTDDFVKNKGQHANAGGSISSSGGGGDSGTKKRKTVEAVDIPVAPQVETAPLQFMDPSQVAEHKSMTSIKMVTSSATGEFKGRWDVTPKKLEEQPLEFLEPHQTSGSFLKKVHQDKHPNFVQNAAVLHHADKSDHTMIHFLDSFSQVTGRSAPNKEDKEAKKKDPVGTSKILQHQMDVAHYHPYESPRPGSNIDLQHQTALLRCPLQSKCVVPQLQLQVKVKVYLCRHPTRQGVRFYFLAREGLLLHPNVQLVNETNMLEADYVVFLPGSSPWHLTECTNPKLAQKMIVLDEFDGHTPLFFPNGTAPADQALQHLGKIPSWYFTYFKRSFVVRKDGLFDRYPHLDKKNIFPMSYAVAETYIQDTFNFKRELTVVCTLRGSEKMTTRLRAQTWVQEYGKLRNLQNMVTGEADTLQRNVISMKYFQQMYNAQIVVTVNPANWEGDFRLWEAMGTGALIFVDPLFVPHQFPLVDGVHVVYYSNSNKTELFEKLDYYLANPKKAREIAINGYLHALKYHRTVSLMDYVLRTTHAQKLMDLKATNPEASSSIALPRYSFTGQSLVYEAKSLQKYIKACNDPGTHVAVPDRNSIISATAQLMKVCEKKKLASAGSEDKTIKFGGRRR